MAGSGAIDCILLLGAIDCILLLLQGIILVNIPF